jgi:chromosome segregation ATPase
MDKFNWAGIIIAAIGKYSARTEAETEAYARARKMDIETIERQDKEIDEIRQNNKELRQKVRTLAEDNQRLREELSTERQDKEALRRRVTHLERLQRGEISE